MRVARRGLRLLILAAFVSASQAATPAETSAAGSPDARAKEQESRARWQELTRGENLALGRMVRFSHQPNYSLTSGGSDPYDLTDGRLSSREDGRIWFDPAAVGWIGVSDLNLMVDLGSVQPIKRFVIRALGGHEAFPFPHRFTMFVSEDGKTFYRAGALTKLMPGEKELAGHGGMFYLEEDGTNAYVYPFAFEVKTKARYVGLNIQSLGRPTLDEIAVIRGDHTPDEVTYRDEDQRGFIMEGIVFAPRFDKLVVSTNVVTPNFIRLMDCRRGKGARAPATFVLDLPRELRVVYGNANHPAAKAERGVAEGGGFRWTIRNVTYEGGGVKDTCFGPVFITVAEGMTPPSHGVARLSAFDAENPARPVRVPIEFIEIPEVPPITELHVSLTWLGSWSCLLYPDFLDAWRHLGFNAVACFPRYWGLPRHDREVAKYRAFLRQARERGFDVIMNESPFHVMEERFKAAAPEMCSQFADGTTSQHICPSYRGKYYRDEIRRVGDMFELTRPDYVFYDIECWYRGALEAAKCTRCLERQAASGKPMTEFLTDMGLEHLTDMKRQIAARAKKAGIPMPRIGSYNTRADRPVYHLVNDFRKDYPAALDMAMPSIYVHGDGLKAHKILRSHYEAFQSNRSIPWLTTGCYGEYPPHRVEHQVLEAFLNGSQGITYYEFFNFDTPLDYYYHARALVMIAPYQGIIKEGRPCPVVNDNDTLTYSGIRHENQMLILIGNYRGSRRTLATVALPYEKVAEIRDARNRKPYPPGRTLTVEVNPDTVALYYIRAE